MELSKEILQELALPFQSNKISIKVQTKPKENGKSLCVAYIDARDVMDRLDEVVAGEWSDSYRQAPSGGLECALTVCGVTRCDVGDDKNDNEAEKAGYSDAFKRAAVKFGVGRFLYNLPKMYATVKSVGKNVYLENGEEKRLHGMIAIALGGKPVQSEPERSAVATERPDKPAQSNERTELVKAFSASFNAIPQDRKGEAKTISGKSTLEEINQATAHNQSLVKACK